MKTIRSARLLLIGLALASSTSVWADMSNQTTGVSNTTSTNTTTATPTNATASSGGLNTTTISNTASALQPASPVSATTTTTTTTVSGTGDAKINSDAQMAIAGNSSLIGAHVTADSVNGVVTLSGTVDNQAQADAIMKVVRGLPGVKDVKSTLSVKTPGNVAPSTTGNTSTLSY